MSQPPRRQIAIIIPTADPDREPARSAIAQARQTTADLGATVHVIVSSGPEFRFSRSVNRGIAAAPDADAWVLLNDDCFMDRGWLESMVETADCHPEAGLVGAVLRYPTGRLHHAGIRLMNPLSTLVYGIRKKAPLWAVRAFSRHIIRAQPTFGYHSKPRPSQRIDLLMGACLLITRPCLERTGLFDEGFEFTFEDTDYCLRALEHGLELALAVDAQGMHISRASGGKMQAAIARSEAYFWAKWSNARLLQATRAGNRRGIYHARNPGFCACTTNVGPIQPRRQS